MPARRPRRFPSPRPVARVAEVAAGPMLPHAGVPHATVPHATVPHAPRGAGRSLPEALVALALLATVTTARCTPGESSTAAMRAA